jgi:hypothetical protein
MPLFSSVPAISLQEDIPALQAMIRRGSLDMSIIGGA